MITKVGHFLFQLGKRLYALLTTHLCMYAYECNEKKVQQEQRFPRSDVFTRTENVIYLLYTIQIQMVYYR